MKRNKLLQRQICKLLPKELQSNDLLTKFLDAVNDSYNAYERDHELANRAFSLSEDEYILINEKLKAEVSLKKKSIEKLKESIETVSGVNLFAENDDIIHIVEYLEKQFFDRKRAEKESIDTANRMSTLIMNLQEGVLLEDENRNILLTNQYFCDLFHIPALPADLIGSNCSGSAELSKDLFKEPELFLKRINHLTKHRKIITNEELELANGRFLERDFIPIFIEREFKGYLWKYKDITGRKKSEAALKASEELWQFALEGAGDGVYEYNFQSKDVFYSRQYKKMLGFDEYEFDASPEEWLRRIHPDDIDVILITDKDYAAKKIKSHEREYRIKHKNGEYIWVLDRGILVNYTDGGKPGRLIGTHTNITSRKEVEKELRRLSLVASANRNGVLFTDEEGKIIWTNEGFESLTGYRSEDIAGITPVNLMKGDQTDQSSIDEIIKLFFEGRHFTKEAICYRKDGTFFWGSVMVQPVMSTESKKLEYFAVLEDITREKEAQKRIADFEYRFRMALEKIGDNFWEHDFTTDKTYFSNASNSLLGYEIDGSEDIAKLWWAETHPDDKILLIENDRKYRSGELNDHSMEYRLLTKNGAIKWILDRGVVIERDNYGKPLRIVGTHTDITERRLAEQGLRFNEEKYRSIIANMNLGLLEVDNNDLILFANNCFCEMCGYELEELLGKHAASKFTDGENLEKVLAKKELRDLDQSDAYEIKVQNKRGELKWWLISGAPRYDDKGIKVGSIGIHLDITEQKNLELELQSARESAEMSSQAKEDFLANMSHEIRTPMNAIMGMGRQLEKSALNPQQRFFLETINKAADHLLVVINDILDMSKIDAGKLNIEHIGFNPEKVIQHCMEVMRHKAEEKGIKLIMKAPVNNNHVILGDPYRITQVLLNLLSNSIKFTEYGYVTLSCECLSAHEGVSTFQFKVTDTGLGMDEKYLETIFEKFSQENSTTARKFGGTGLGMPICKTLVELMGGNIVVKSVKSKGTEVIITIPFNEGLPGDLPDETKKIMDTSVLEGKRILLVEDNEMNRLVAVTILEQYGVKITEAVNGEEAINELQSGQFNIVLMDVQMPVLNGLDATRHIRKHINAKIPIIALTANAIKGENERCFSAGMNAFVSKPFEEDDLVNMIVEWLDKSVSAIKPPELTSEKTGNAVPLYDLSKLEKLSNNNEDFIKKMITLFIDQAPAAIKEVNEAYNEGNMSLVKSVLHRIKPSVDSMGMKSMYQEIKLIESHFESGSPQLIKPESIKKLSVIMEKVAFALTNLNK
jgi:PAS domain S-box-containing protein